MRCSPRVAGLTTILLSVLFFYLGSLPIRWEKNYGTLGGAEFIFTRFLLGSLIVCLLQLRRGRMPRPDGALVLGGRVIFHFLAGWLYYVAIELSNAALGNVLHMTYPFFAALILLAAGRSRTPYTDLAISTISVAGIALTCDLAAGDAHAVSIGLLSGICGAMSVILLTSTRKGNSTVDVFFYTFLGGVVLSLLVAKPHFEIHSPMEWWLLAVSAAFGIAGQFCFTYGAAFLHPVDTSVLSCLRIPLALFGAALGIEQAPLSAASWLGAGMIFAANVIIIRRRRPAEAAAEVEEPE